MGKLKNYSDGVKLICKRLLAFNLKQLLNTIKYRIKYGFFYSETWNLGHDVSQYVFKRLWQYYDTGYTPSFIKNQDMISEGFEITTDEYGNQYTPDQYSKCWRTILDYISYYLSVNTMSHKIREDMLNSIDGQMKYTKGAIYFGKYLPYLYI